MSSQIPNLQQQQVIDELDKNILLLASAGTGKTGTLAKRIANIIAKGRAKASEILCLTFTNKASKEILEAVEETVGNSARNMVIRTFHSFCFKILQDEAKSSGKFYNEMTIIDEDDAGVMINEIIYHNPNDIKSAMANFTDKEIFYIMNYFREERALRNIYTGNPYEDFSRTIKDVAIDKTCTERVHNLFTKKYSFNGNLHTYFLVHGAEFITKYESSLAEENAVDFTGLIVGVKELFRDKNVLEIWRNKFSYITIDEVQDTSILEYEVLKELWNGNNILLSGDFFQTIYEWRGSAPFKILKEYKDKFKPEIITFYENYRSTQCIFENSLTVLEQLFPQDIWEVYDKRPRAYTADMGKKVTVKRASDDVAEAAYIFKEILNKQKAPDENICVLVRDNFKAKSLAQAFEGFNSRLEKSKRKNFMLVDQFSFYRRREIKDVLAILKLVLNPADAESAKRIMTRFVSRVGEGTLRRLDSQEYRETGLRIADFLNMKIFEEDPYECLEQALNNDEVIVFDVESTGVDTTSDEIIQMAAIRIDSRGNVVEKFERFIKPNKSVGDSEKVHHFNDEFLQENGEDAKVVFNDFLEFAKNKVIVGHNVNYDISILDSELMRKGLNQAEFKGVYDTLDIYRRFHPNEKNHKLENLANVYDTKHKPSHNAMDDILATAELLVKAMENDILPTKDKRRLYIYQDKGYFAGMAVQIATLRNKSKTEMPKELLRYIMVDMKLADYYAKLDEKAAMANARISNPDYKEEGNRLNNLRNLYKIFQEKEDDFISEQNSKGKIANPRELLQRVVNGAALQNSEINLNKNPDNIPIITVHQSKGSEFHYVYLAGVNDGTFPVYWAVRNGNEKEEKRVFYVALTRAKKELTISYSKKPSKYLELLDKRYVEYEK